MCEREVAMPRIRREVDKPNIAHPEVLKDLVTELRNCRNFGQPMIDQLVLPKTGALNITVIWDRWEALDDEERLNIIMMAYEEVEGKKFVDNIALALGLTVPEAIEANFLPFEVIAALRKATRLLPSNVARRLSTRELRCFTMPTSHNCGFARCKKPRLVLKG